LTSAEIELIAMREADPPPERRRGPLAAMAHAALDHSRRTAPYVRRLADHARARAIDLVHLNNSVVANLGGIVAARWLRVPCVVKQHGYEWDAAETRWAARSVRHFMPCSEDIARDLERLGVSRERMTVTY